MVIFQIRRDLSHFTISWLFTNPVRQFRFNRTKILHSSVRTKCPIKFFNRVNVAFNSFFYKWRRSGHHFDSTFTLDYHGCLLMLSLACELLYWWCDVMVVMLDGKNNNLFDIDWPWCDIPSNMAASSRLWKPPTLSGFKNTRRSRVFLDLIKRVHGCLQLQRSGPKAASSRGDVRPLYSQAIKLCF